MSGSIKDLLKVESIRYDIQFCLRNEVEKKLMLKSPKRIILERMEGLRDVSLSNKRSRLSDEDGGRNSIKIYIKIQIFIEFDDVSWEQDDKGVGQAKLTEGLMEQKEEDDEWEKEEWEVEGDNLTSKELNVEEVVGGRVEKKRR